MNKKKLKIITTGIIIYLLSTGISYTGFVLAGKKSGGGLLSPQSGSEKESKKITVDPQEPKTETCPLNGKLYTETEKKIWEERRPLAVMIENHTEARPQSGLSYADIVYEAVAEGGITRFMGVFYCAIAAKSVNLAPVRSARTYFLDWVSEYDALYNHVGGAGQCHDQTVDERAKALCQIDEYGLKDLDQFSIPYPVCFRNPDRTGRTVATEHQMVCVTDKLYNFAKEERGWTNIDNQDKAWNEDFRAWKFTEENPAGVPEAESISFNFWQGYKDFQVTWMYDKESNSYQRNMGGEDHIDFENKKQIKAKNVVVQLTQEIGPVDGHKHLIYKTIGEGKALIFQDGKVKRGKWEKEDRTSRTLYFDNAGNEISFIPGQIWVEIVPAGNTVDY